MMGMFGMDASPELDLNGIRMLLLLLRWNLGIATHW